MLLSSRQQELPADLWPSFLLNENPQRRTVRSVSIHAEKYRCWLNQTKCESSYLQHAVALPFKQATVTETTTICDRMNIISGCFQASWGDVPAVFIGQSVQGDCSLTAGAFEETFYRVMPPEVMILLHATIRWLEVGVIALEKKSRLLTTITSGH